MKKTETLCTVRYYTGIVRTFIQSLHYLSDIYRFIPYLRFFHATEIIFLPVVPKKIITLPYFNFCKHIH